MNSILEGMGFGVGFAVTYWSVDVLFKGAFLAVQRRKEKKAAKEREKYLSVQEAQMIGAVAAQQSEQSGIVGMIDESLLNKRKM